MTLSRAGYGVNTAPSSLSGRGRFRLRLLLVLLVGFVWLLPLQGGRVFAQAVKPQLVVDNQAASPHFPDTVDFTLRAHGFEAYRADLNYRLVGDPVTSQVTVNLDSTSANINAQASLDLSTHYMPPGSTVVYYWTLTGDTAQAIYTPEKSFDLVDTRHHWQDLTDSKKQVSVHWYSGSQDFGKSLLDTSSEALGRLQTEIGAGLERPAGVWVYATQDDLLNALPKNLPEWVGGKAFPDLALVMAAIPDDLSSGDEIKRVVPHELSHLVLYQATRNPYNSPPAWMDEGLAVHNQEWQDPTEEAALKDAAAQGKVIPLKSLSGSFGADEAVATLSYAESRSVMDFVLSDSRYGSARFARTVAAFKEGVTYDDALKAGLGITTDELNREWLDTLPYKVATPGAQNGQGSSSYVPRPAGDPGAIFGTAWGNLAILAGVGVCALLFVLGGLLTLLALVRRRAL